MLFGATDNLLKSKTLAKMHQTYHFLFFSVHTILLILLLLEEMHAATLHGTTRRNNDIQVLKGVYRVTVCIVGPGLQGHPIDFSNHFHLFGFNVQVLISQFYIYFCCWSICMRQRCTGPLVYTIKSGVLFVCFVCLFCDARHAFRGRRTEQGMRGVHGKP